MLLPCCWLQPAPPAEQPKWRVSTKPRAAAAAGFADEAYAECFPSMTDYSLVEDDELPAETKAGAKAAAATGAKGAAGKGGGGGTDDAERKMKGKLHREVQQMQGIFKEKGWGSEAAFRKPERLDAVAATPSRKRLRI